jgi:hypothetical protein
LNFFLKISENNKMEDDYNPNGPALELIAEFGDDALLRQGAIRRAQDPIYRAQCEASPSYQAARREANRLEAWKERICGRAPDQLLDAWVDEMGQHMAENPEEFPYFKPVE